MLRHSIGWGAAAVALAFGGLAVVGPPAGAAVGGSVTLTAQCAGDGSPDGYATLHEDFSGLDYPQPTYRVVAERNSDAGGSLEDGGWYAEPDGSHVFDHVVFFGVTTDDPDIRAGESYAWTLYRTYGAVTTVASGTVVAGGPTCVKYTKPKPAVLANSPDTALVNPHRHFGYTFRARAGLHGTIRVTRHGSPVAGLDFVVPASGKEAAVLTLHRDAYRALKRKGRLSTEVTVKLTRHGLSSRARKDLVLKPA